MDTSNALRFASRQRECDLVMRGGVTSGIVYPTAAAELARTFTFRAIGGTSAGAIAAVITAAAQYGVSSGANPKAFDAISHLPDRLAEPVGGHSFINRLFTPDAATTPLYQLVAAATSAKTGRGRVRAVLSSAIVRPRLARASAATAALAGGLALWAGATPAAALVAALPAAVAGAALGLVLAGAHVYRRLVPALVANRYGLCSGMAQAAGLSVRDAEGRAAAMPSLTGWMHELIQASAGRDAAGDPPLTFGDLWIADPKLWPGKAPPDPDRVANRAIDLVLLTTNITRGISTRIPHMTQFGPLFARKADLEALFPPPVVAHIVATGDRLDPARTRPAAGDTADDYVKLPEAKHLPILFGARLSLSFPFLISAVPLYAPLRRTADRSEPATLVRCWFSDGGLTSNFPIHFFDAPIPSRPTFAINLAEADVEFPASIGDVAATTGPDRTALERVGYAFVRRWRCRDYPNLMAQSKHHPPSYRRASNAHHAYATDTLDAYVDFIDRRAQRRRAGRLRSGRAVCRQGWRRAAAAGAHGDPPARRRGPAGHRHRFRCRATAR